MVVRKSTLAVFLLAVLFGVLLVGSGGSVYGDEPPQLSRLLARRVSSFRVEKTSKLDALLNLGRQEHIPLGIEYVDFQALEKPISINIGPSTIAETLDAIFGRGSGYSWSVQDGVLHISHKSLRKSSRNLLDRRLPRFSIRKVSLQDGGHVLQMTLQGDLQPQLQGWVGSYPTGSSSKKVGPLELQNITVRQALNRLVAEAGDAAWIVQVPPGALDSLPSYGLWRVIEYDEANPRPLGPFLLEILRNFKRPTEERGEPRN